LENVVNIKAKKSKADISEILRQHAANIFFVFMLLINLAITPNFFNAGTIWNIIVQTTTILLTGMGMAMVISTGGIDISVGSMMAVGSMVTAKLMFLGIMPAIMIGLLVCVFFGLVSGFMVGKLKCQPMVVTLAMSIGLRGLAQVINNAKILFLGNEYSGFFALGRYKIFGVLPIQIVPMVIVVGLVYFIIEKTVLGRKIQAAGDNPRSASLAGINTVRTINYVYMFSALFAGLAGIIVTAKAGAADGNSVGVLAELDAIAAVAVGGSSMSGGRTKVFGTVVGALIMQLITISVNMNNIPFEVSEVLKAVIIILAVYAQREKAS
jgi:ribose transport system permease protein